MKKKGLPYQQKSGFKIPDGYFQDFEARMMREIGSLDKEEKERQNNPFSVPDNYFDSFEQRMMARLKEEPKETKVVPLHRKKVLSYVAGIAAVLAVIFSSVLLNDSRDVGFEDLDMLAVENYLLETLDIVNPEENPLINDREFSFATSPSTNLDREALYDYLNENVDDPSILLNEE